MIPALEKVGELTVRAGIERRLDMRWALHRYRLRECRRLQCRRDEYGQKQPNQPSPTHRALLRSKTGARLVNCKAVAKRLQARGRSMKQSAPSLRARPEEILLPVL